MPSVLTSRVKRNLLRGCAVATVAIGILLPTAASAQISRVGISVGSLEPGIQMRGTDTAYDPVRDVYLLVTGSGPVFGVFVNAMGVPVTGAFAVMDGSLGWAHFPRAEYQSRRVGRAGRVSRDLAPQRRQREFRVWPDRLDGEPRVARVPDPAAVRRNRGRELVGNRACDGVLSDEQAFPHSVENAGLRHQWPLRRCLGGPHQRHPPLGASGGRDRQSRPSTHLECRDR